MRIDGCITVIAPARPDEADDRRQAGALAARKNPADGWLAEYTEDLLKLLNVLARLIALEPRQADSLSRIVAGPLVAVADGKHESGTTDDEPSP